jgi:hypothetical protein
MSWNGHCKAAKDFIKGLLCPTSCYQDEVHNNDCLGQQKHGSPTYISMMVHYKKDKEERMQFFFCKDDI